MTAAEEEGRHAEEQAVEVMEQLRFANQDLQGAYGHYGYLAAITPTPATSSHKFSH